MLGQCGLNCLEHRIGTGSLTAGSRANKDAGLITVFQRFPFGYCLLLYFVKGHC
jgi:hypothetical protein